jgi:hypothetical protein
LLDVYTEQNAMGTNIAVTGITKANPAVVTTAVAHGPVSGQSSVRFLSVGGMAQINFLTMPNYVVAATLERLL